MRRGGDTRLLRGEYTAPCSVALRSSGARTAIDHRAPHDQIQPGGAVLEAPLAATVAAVLAAGIGKGMCASGRGRGAGCALEITTW
jgi:hypothetical protein